MTVSNPVRTEPGRQVEVLHVGGRVWGHLDNGSGRTSYSESTDKHACFLAEDNPALAGFASNRERFPRIGFEVLLLSEKGTSVSKTIAEKKQ